MASTTDPAQIAVQLTRLFDQAFMSTDTVFGPVIVPGFAIADYQIVSPEIASTAASGSILLGGNSDFRTVQWTVNGQVRVVLREVATGVESLYPVPFTFTGQNLLWAPRPAQMSVLVQADTSVLNAFLTDEPEPGAEAIGINVDVILCALVSTTGPQQHYLPEQDLPEVAVPLGRVAQPVPDCDYDNFVIPSKPQD